ncbi:hypothetical protein [Streptomyces atratus]|uniref:hypothetical protein n=1 Tax=Streptomyces atratus TaxID=1893 RepID=UPI0033DC5D94
MQTIIKSFGRKRLVIFFVCVVVVLAGIVGWATVGGDDGPPGCARAMAEESRADLEEVVDCSARVAEWCHEQHPEDTSGCTKAVVDDGDDRNVGKNPKPARDATAAPSDKSTLSPMQQAFEDNRRALYDWYEMGLDPLGISITKMELKSDGYVYITTDQPSTDHDHDAGLDSFSSYHQDDFETTLKHMIELKGVKGIKTFYSDGKAIQPPDLSSVN